MGLGFLVGILEIRVFMVGRVFCPHPEGGAKRGGVCV